MRKGLLLLLADNGGQALPGSGHCRQPLHGFGLDFSMQHNCFGRPANWGNATAVVCQFETLIALVQVPHSPRWRKQSQCV